MFHKKEKQKKLNEPVEAVANRKHSKPMSFGLFLWRFTVVILLIALNAGLWAYAAYEIKISQEKREFDLRKQQQILLAREQKRKQALEDAVALVNDEPITMAQVRDFVNSMPQLAELPFETVYPNVLDMMINSRVVMLGAAQAGVPERPEIKRLLSQSEEQIVGQTYLDELLSAQVSEAELQALYDKEVKEFRREEEIHARHILVKTEQEAKDLIIQLKAGADFAELASKKSLDENTEGGDLGYFTKGMMIPEFGDVVFDMKKGQLSNPIKTPFGWHVVLVEDKRLANPPAFEDVRDEIRRAVMETKLQAVLSAERAKMNVQVLKPSASN